ncbi:alport syndrome [Lactarius deliciosus]|nr:alport syndrome [Lactarius deliciosus]
MVRAAAAKGDTASPSVDGDAAATTAACRPEHAFHAFDALYCALTRAQPIKPAFADDKFPLFVTWNTRRYSGSTRLRGCIGTFDAQPLRTALREYALVSAFRDHRFERIELRELPSLECGISLLTDFEDAASYLDWYPSRPRARSPRRTSPRSRRSRGGTTSTRSTARIRKAGWDGRISEDLRRGVRVRRYQSRKCVVGWDEFVAWRAERGAPVDLDAFEGI